MEKADYLDGIDRTSPRSSTSSTASTSSSASNSRPGSISEASTTEAARPVLRLQEIPNTPRGQGQRRFSLVFKRPSSTPKSVSSGTPQRRSSAFGWVNSSGTPSTPSNRQQSPMAQEESKTPETPRTPQRKSSILGWMTSLGTPSNRQKSPAAQEVITPPRRPGFFGCAAVPEAGPLPPPDFMTAGSSGLSSCESLDALVVPILTNPSIADVLRHERELRGLSMPPEAPFRGREGFINPYSVSEKASKMLALTSATTSQLPRGMLLPEQYSELVRIILNSKGPVKGYGLVKEKVIAYEGVLNADKTRFKTYEIRQQAVSDAAQDCLVAMKNYQVLFKKKQFYKAVGEEDLGFDLQFQRMIEHVESSYPSQANTERNKKLHLLDELQKSKIALDEAGRGNDDEELLRQTSNLIKHGCAYEKIYRDYEIMKKVRSEIGKHSRRLDDMAQKHMNDFFGSIGNTSIIELAFSGNPLCKPLHGVICGHLKNEHADENYLFLDQLQRFLEVLHKAHLKGSFSQKQKLAFLQEIHEIHDKYVSEKGSFSLNLNGDVRLAIKQKVADLSTQCESGQIDDETFYINSFKLFNKAQSEIRKINFGALDRLKVLPQAPSLLQGLLKSILSKN